MKYLFNLGLNNYLQILIYSRAFSTSYRCLFLSFMDMPTTLIAQVSSEQLLLFVFTPHEQQMVRSLCQQQNFKSLLAFRGKKSENGQQK